MFEKDSHIIAYALHGWANWIETHDITLSAADAINMKKSEMVNALSQDQMKFIVRLRDLSKKHFNEKS